MIWNSKKTYYSNLQTLPDIPIIISMNLTSKKKEYQKISAN